MFIMIHKFHHYQSFNYSKFSVMINSCIFEKRKVDIVVTTTSKKPVKEYLHEVDFMRLFFIFGVILNHTINTILSAMNGTDSASTTLQNIRLMFHYSRNGFLFMSGLVLTLNYFNRHDWKTFYRKRFSGSLWPYLTWNLIFLLLFSVVDQVQISSTDFFVQYLNIIIHGSRFYMYYMLLVMQLYLIFPGIVWIFKKWPNHHLRITAISLLIQIVLDALIKYKLQYIDLSSLPYWFRAFSINIFSYQFYFIFGAYVSLHYKDVYAFISKYIKIIAPTAIVLAFGTIFYLREFNMNVLGLNYDLATSPHQPYMQIFDVLMIITIFWVGKQYAAWRNNGIPFPIEWFVKNGAKVSFGIYLNQSIGLLILRILLSHLQLSNWGYFMLIPIEYGLVILISFGLAWFCFKVAPFGFLIGRPQWHFHSLKLVWPLKKIE